MGTRWLCGEGHLWGPGSGRSRRPVLSWASPSGEGKWWYRDGSGAAVGALSRCHALPGSRSSKAQTPGGCCRRLQGAAEAQRGRVARPASQRLLSSGAGAVPLQGVRPHCSALCCFTLQASGGVTRAGRAVELSDRVAGGGSWEEVAPERSCWSAEESVLRGGPEAGVGLGGWGGEAWQRGQPRRAGQEGAPGQAKAPGQGARLERRRPR